MNKKKRNSAKKVMMPYVKTQSEIDLIEVSCRIVAETLMLCKKYMVPGTELIEIDKMAEDYIRSKGGRPAFKGYEVDGLIFPHTLCMSVDEEVVHGMPGSRKLEEGMIISIDCGCEKEGYFGDSAVTYAVGEITDEKKNLMKVTEESLMLGIAQAVSNNKVFDISRAVQEHVEKHGYSVTRELVGHGIGKRLHEEPPVPNFVPPLLYRSRYPNVKLLKGHALAIEPMVHAGEKAVRTAADGWTVYTADRSPAAHFEHTVIVDDEKPIIMTLRD
jgi:methionyl aminopeptidase